MPVVNCRYINGVVWDKPDRFDLGHTVHVYRLQFARHLHYIPQLLPLLSDAELERAQSYFHERDKQRFILSRGMLRVILAKYLGQSAVEIKFIIGKNKKPYIQHKSHQLQYNIAHAGDMAVIAIGSTDLGVDVEKTTTYFNYNDVLPICFSDKETELINNAASPREKFYLLWTRKEALLKATGRGIDDDMALVPCIDGAHTARRELTGTDEDITVLSFEVGECYTASVAYNAEVHEVLFRECEGLL